MVAEPSTSAAGKASNKRKAKKGANSTENATIRSPEPSGNQDSIPSHKEEDRLNGDGPYESPHIKELQKNIRNVNKKLAGMAKVDAIREEFPDLSPDDLLTTKKINADQRAQIDKKPALQAQLARFEEQLGAFRKVEEDFQKRLELEKERLVASHSQQLEEAKKVAKVEEGENSRKELRQKLLVLSKFLRAAAARRQVEEDNTEDGRGFEGVLLLLYGGDVSAVDAAERVINGTDDKIPSTEGTLLDVKYERIKQLSLEFAPFAQEEAWMDEVAQAEAHKDVDATHEGGAVSEATNALANASISQQNTASQAAGTEEQTKAPAQTSVDPGAANDTANNGLTNIPAEGQGLGDSWVSVPRDPKETENSWNAPAVTKTAETWGLSDEPSTAAGSWADDANNAAAQSNGGGQDGFHEVRGRGGRVRGGWGDFRGGGRGRGGFRGGPDGARGRGGFRGDRGDRGGEGSFRGRGRGGRGRAREGS